MAGKRHQKKHKNDFDARPAETVAFSKKAISLKAVWREGGNPIVDRMSQGQGGLPSGVMSERRGGGSARQDASDGMSDGCYGVREDEDYRAIIIVM